MKIDVGKIALVAVMIAGIQVNVLYHRIDDLECQRDIYKSRYEDWEGVSKEIAEYADTDVYKRQSPACTRQCWPTPATL